MNSINRYLVWLFISLGFGIYMNVSVNPVIRNITVLCIVLLCLNFFMLLILRMVGKISKLFSGKWIFSLFLLMSFAFGTIYPEIYSKISDSDIRNYIGEWVTIQGTVKMPPKYSTDSSRVSYIVEVDSIKKQNQVIKSKGTIMISVSGEENDIKFGDGISCFAQLTTPASARFEGGFDYGFYLKSQDIYVIAYTRYAEKILPHNASSVFSSIGINIRISIINAVDKYVGSKFKPVASSLTADKYESTGGRKSLNDILYNTYGNDVPALLKGILVGDKTGFSDKLYTDFSKTGIAHIAAISGMHVSILFAILSLLLGYFKINKVSVHIIMIFVLLIFMSVTLYTPSVIRASVMMIIFLVAYILRRDSDRLTSLFISGGVIILINPYTLFNASFILSFSTTLCLIIYCPLISKRLSFLNKIPTYGRYIREGLAVSLSTSIGSVYFTSYFFNVFSLAQFIINLFIIPLMGFIFATGYILWIFNILGLGIISEGISYLVSIPLVFIIELADFFESIPFMWYNVASPDVMGFTLYLSVCAGLYYLLKIRDASL